MRRACAEGGFAPPEIVDLLRGVASEVGGEAAWMMVVDGEGVGMISIKERDAKGRWDIGYGVAPSREGRGHATAAVAELRGSRQGTGATGLTAETLPGHSEPRRRAPAQRLSRASASSIIPRTVSWINGWWSGAVTDIDTLRADLLAQIDAAATPEAIEAVRVAALGKSGSVTGLLKTLGACRPRSARSKGRASTACVKPSPRR